MYAYTCTHIYKYNKYKHDTLSLYDVTCACVFRDDWTITTDMLVWSREILRGLSPTQKSKGNKVMLSVGETVFPGEGHPYWLSNTKR